MYGGKFGDTGVLQHLDLSFPYKPTGATEIKVYSFVEDDEAWTELFDLLDIQAVDTHPNSETYSPVDIFKADEGIYADYLAGEIDGFFIGITMKGGIFDGAELQLP